MKTKRRHEGYLRVENPAGVQFGDPVAALRSGRVWIAPPPSQAVYENSTISCNHCKNTWVKHPRRRRERAWCWSCDHYICDPCAAVRAVAGCRTMAQIMDQHERLVVRAQ